MLRNECWFAANLNGQKSHKNTRLNREECFPKQAKKKSEMFSLICNSLSHWKKGIFVLSEMNVEQVPEPARVSEDKKSMKKVI